MRKLKINIVSAFIFVVLIIFSFSLIWNGLKLGLQYIRLASDPVKAQGVVTDIYSLTRCPWYSCHISLKFTDLEGIDHNVRVYVKNPKEYYIGQSINMIYYKNDPTIFSVQNYDIWLLLSLLSLFSGFSLLAWLVKLKYRVVVRYYRKLNKPQPLIIRR